MYNRAKKELDSLKEKKRIVENDKEKIEQVIKELDIKKEEAIRITHTRVNVDLKDIVSQCIPGYEGELVETTKGERGLELVVKCSVVEKRSDGSRTTIPSKQIRKNLGELSGGQRSLIALALVLALLKFKPAPIYILDEIDAALDLQNTQSIGRMLRNSFKQAQFIVVSLKEGMWNNANVLFRTSFRDSNSEVTRVTN